MEAVIQKKNEGQQYNLVVGSGRSVQKMIRAGIEIEGEQFVSFNLVVLRR